MDIICIDSKSLLFQGFEENVNFHEFIMHPQRFPVNAIYAAIDANGSFVKECACFIITAPNLSGISINPKQCILCIIIPRKRS